MKTATKDSQTTLQYKFLPAEFKVDKGKRTVEGYASIFGNVDQYGDIVHPGAFTESLLTGRGKDAPVLWLSPIRGLSGPSLDSRVVHHPGIGYSL